MLTTIQLINTKQSQISISVQLSRNINVWPILRGNEKVKVTIALFRDLYYKKDAIDGRRPYSITS